MPGKLWVIKVGVGILSCEFMLVLLDETLKLIRFRYVKALLQTL